MLSHEQVAFVLKPCRWDTRAMEARYWTVIYFLSTSFFYPDNSCL